MKKRLGIAARVAVLLLLLLAIVLYLTDVLKLKWKYPCYESVVPVEFYELDKDSVEVCAIGSSQVVYGISGMELYGQYGISSYSLGSALQPMEASYTWLQEVRKTQDIRLVLMDISMLYESSDEARYRQAYDNMRMSWNKLQAVYRHCTTSEDADPLISYIFPIIKYHNRWTGLTEDDFTMDSQDHPVFRGNYAYALSEAQDIDAVAYDNDAYEPELTMRADQLEWFEKIVEYCDAEGLELLLIKTPKSSWSLTKHEQMAAYAEEHGLDFIDFSSQQMISLLGLDLTVDFRDEDHLNIVGAKKLSTWLGAYMKEHYDLTDFREVEGYDDMGYERYCERLEDSKVQLATDPAEYFSYIDNDRYETVVQLTAGPTTFATAELAQAFLDAGSSIDLTQTRGIRYVAWFRGGECVYEQVGEEAFEYADRFSDTYGFRLFTNFDTDTKAKMRVNYETQNYSRRGLNVLVYDTENHTVVDKTTFYNDTATGTMGVCKDNDSYNTRLD